MLEKCFSFWRTNYCHNLDSKILSLVSSLAKALLIFSVNSIINSVVNAVLLVLHPSFNLRFVYVIFCIAFCSLQFS